MPAGPSSHVTEDGKIRPTRHRSFGARRPMSGQGIGPRRTECDAGRMVMRHTGFRIRTWLHLELHLHAGRRGHAKQPAVAMGYGWQWDCLHLTRTSSRYQNGPYVAIRNRGTATGASAALVVPNPVSVAHIRLDPEFNACAARAARAPIASIRRVDTLQRDLRPAIFVIAKPSTALEDFVRRSAP